MLGQVSSSFEPFSIASWEAEKTFATPLNVDGYESIFVMMPNVSLNTSLTAFEIAVRNGAGSFFSERKK